MGSRDRGSPSSCRTSGGHWNDRPRLLGARPSLRGPPGVPSTPTVKIQSAARLLRRTQIGPARTPAHMRVIPCALEAGALIAVLTRRPVFPEACSGLQCLSYLGRFKAARSGEYEPEAPARALAMALREATYPSLALRARNAFSPRRGGVRRGVSILRRNSMKRIILINRELPHFRPRWITEGLHFGLILFRNSFVVFHGTVHARSFPLAFG